MKIIASYIVPVITSNGPNKTIDYYEIFKTSNNEFYRKKPNGYIVKFEHPELIKEEIN